jgi:hypothetical protein
MMSAPSSPLIVSAPAAPSSVSLPAVPVRLWPAGMVPLVGKPSRFQAVKAAALTFSKVKTVT